jgi:hypothetical protein
MRQNTKEQLTVKTKRPSSLLDELLELEERKHRMPSFTDFLNCSMLRIKACPGLQFAGVLADFSFLFPPPFNPLPEHTASPALQLWLPMGPGFSLS